MTLRTRDQIDPAYRWDVGSIYPDDARWEADYTAITARLPELAACTGTLGHSAPPCWPPSSCATQSALRLIGWFSTQLSAATRT